MKTLNLFQSGDGSWVTSATLLTILEKIKAPEASVLYIHSGLNFGTPNPDLGRKELLAHLYGLIASLGVPTICFPTFTFSFCNGEDYNVQTSRSRMGALNEYVRGLPETVRSEDPLMSSVVVGEDHDLVHNLGKDSIGTNSTFDKLHQRGSGVKFLFFGVTVSDCFTWHTTTGRRKAQHALSLQSCVQWPDYHEEGAVGGGYIPAVCALPRCSAKFQRLARRIRFGPDVACFEERPPVSFHRMSR